MRNVQIEDVDNWRKYSHEVIDDQLLGSGLSIEKFFGPFDDFMKSKIEKQQAILMENEIMEIQGCIAFSRTNKRITYFCIKNENEFHTIGKQLFDCAINEMKPYENIRYPSLKLKSTYSIKEKSFLDEYGFVIFDANFKEEEFPAILYMYKSK